MELLERIEAEAAGGEVADPKAIESGLSPRTLPTPGPRPAETEASPQRRTSRTASSRASHAGGGRPRSSDGRRTGGRTHGKGGHAR
jgi:hypothetical protein